MDFKKLLKSKYFTTICALVLLIVVFASLVQISNVFYILACITASALCIVVGVRSVLNYKNCKNNNEAELLPLTQEEKEMVNRRKRNTNANHMIKAIMFFIFAVVFLALILG